MQKDEGITYMDCIVYTLHPVRMFETAKENITPIPIWRDVVKIDPPITIHVKATGYLGLVQDKLSFLEGKI